MHPARFVCARFDFDSQFWNGVDSRHFFVPLHLVKLWLSKYPNEASLLSHDTTTIWRCPNQHLSIDDHKDHNGMSTPKPPLRRQDHYESYHHLSSNHDGPHLCFHIFQCNHPLWSMFLPCSPPTWPTWKALAPITPRIPRKGSSDDLTTLHLPVALLLGGKWSKPAGGSSLLSRRHSCWAYRCRE